MCSGIGYSESRVRRFVRHHVLLLRCIVARHDRTRRFAVAEIDGEMRFAWRDEEEIACFTDDRRRQIRTAASLHAAFEHVDRGLVATVSVRFGSAAWRDRDEMHLSLI